MGLLNLFSKAAPEAKVTQLPSGSFTVDRTGKIVASTLPRTFPEASAKEIGNTVIKVFQSASDAQLTLREVFIHYGGFKITARELRGGAIVFLSPKTMK
ncbi:MAG: hypothetical protein AB1705_04780 [Verrucomicrobiota bacterium]